jgi:hypothetical protein
MADIPTLFASEPLSISATYDKLWVREIVISAQSAAKPRPA